MDADVDEAPAIKQKAGLFSDPRFVSPFEEPGFDSRSTQRAVNFRCSSLLLQYRRVECLG
jgi:hypothetical protein